MTVLGLGSSLLVIIIIIIIMFSRPKILFLVSLLFVALLNPKFNPYLLFKFLFFYHSSLFTFYTC